MAIKNSNETIENRTRDPPGCSAMPQPTAPPRALMSNTKWRISSAVERLSASQVRSCLVELVNNARPVHGVVKWRSSRDARVLHCLHTRWGMQEAFQNKGILTRGSPQTAISYHSQNTPV